MLEIIITLLLALGIELNDESNVNVVDQQTGISYGVGTTLGNGQGISAPPTTYVLMRDANGEYYLVQR